MSTPSPANGFASPPVYALVDSDPDGLSILATYKHGSMSLPHENEQHTCPSLQWLGVRPEDFVGAETITTIHSIEGLLPLSLRDRRKACKMIERAVEHNDGSEFLRDLQLMLMLNIKAEIQILEAREGGLTEWLLQRLSPAM